VRVTRSARRGLAAASATAAFAVALAVAHTPQAALAQTACEALVQHALPNARVLTATAVGAGQFESPGGRAGDVPFTALPAFCRVEASLHPTSDSDIRVELWLPASGWNRGFLGVGNRGWGGSISYGLLAEGLAAGYASVSTDTGHRGGGAEFALGHSERVVDAGWRAVHEMTVRAKQLTTTFYGSAPRRSIWNGCSLGGRQGLMEAQRFPEDYDAVIAGDPASNLTDLYASRLAWWQASRGDGEPVSAQTFRIVHDAVLAQCDAADGVRDGVVENPAACRVDPGTLACPASGGGAACLSPGQVKAVESLWSPVRLPNGGRVLSQGFAPGSELGWAAVAGAQPENNAVGLFRFVVTGDAAWDPRAFDLAKDVSRAAGAAGVLDAVDPDLRPFFARGGKLLLYHGWSDPQTPPGNTIAYRRRVLETSGGDAADNLRLFMVPGMGHCEGGPGTDRFDEVVTMARWLDSGVAPPSIEAAHATSGRIDRTRPLCAFGTVARWDGRGDPDAGSSFTCAAAPQQVRP